MRVRVRVRVRMQRGSIASTGLTRPMPFPATDAHTTRTVKFAGPPGIVVDTTLSFPSAPPPDFFMPLCASPNSLSSLPPSATQAQFATPWRESNPAFHTESITFERFRAHGLRRTVKEGSRQRFVTPVRVLQILRGTRAQGELREGRIASRNHDVETRTIGKLKAVGLTEYIDVGSMRSFDDTMRAMLTRYSRSNSLLSRMRSSKRFSFEAVHLLRTMSAHLSFTALAWPSLHSRSSLSISAAASRGRMSRHWPRYPIGTRWSCRSAFLQKRTPQARSGRLSRTSVVSASTTFSSVHRSSRALSWHSPI